MGVIESLQRQSKQTDDDEASEETDGTDERPDVVLEDAELCSETSDMLKEDTEGKEGIQKSPTKFKPQEQKTASGGDSIPTEKPLKKPDSVDDEHEKSGKETIKAAVDNKVKRTNKRKADDSPGARVKTRKQKA